MELLIEQIGTARFELVEDQKRPGKYIARGEFGKADVPTNNRRLYKKSLWLREFGKLSESINRKRMFGELDHPDDGKTKLARVSHVITSLSINEDGIVIGEAEILDTPNGRVFKTLVDAGCEVGVSSRGFGSTVDNDGVLEVQDDFYLKTFDFVADPADRDAFPEVKTESLSEETIAQQFPDLVDEAVLEKAEALANEKVASLTAEVRATVEASLRDEFELAKNAAVEAMREDVRNEVREELMNDPEVGQAKLFMGRLGEMFAPFLNPDTLAKEEALHAAEIEAKEAKEEAAEAMELARIAGFRLYVEDRIYGHPLRETIKSIMGRYSSFETTEEVQDTLDSVLADLQSIAPAVASGRSDESDERDRLSALVDSLSSSLADAEERLAKAVEIGEALGSKVANSEEELKRLNAELAKASGRARAGEKKLTRLAELPGAAKWTKALERVENAEDVDLAADRAIDEEMTDPLLQRMRERTKARGSSNRGQSEGAGAGRLLSEDLLGISIDDINRLAGV